MKDLENDFKKEIYQQVVSIFKKNENDGHGLNHSLEVVSNINEIIDNNGIALSDENSNILIASGYLHDIGYLEKKSTWSIGCIEHIDNGMKIAESILNKNFKKELGFLGILRVLDLINRHDDTNYKYPIIKKYQNSGKIENSREFLNNFFLRKYIRFRNRILLKILREADGLAGTGIEGAKRTFTISVGKELPVFPGPDHIGSWAWNESIVSNIKLANNRAFLDSFTSYGIEKSRKLIGESEKFISQICTNYGHPFVPELPEIKLKKHFVKIKNITILQYIGWEDTRAIVKNIGLKGNKDIHPYEFEEICLTRVKVKDLLPLSKYLIKKQLDFGRWITSSFIEKYRFSPFDLSGIAEYSLQNLFSNRKRLARISPPIIEIYKENEGEFAGKTVKVIVDGLHRISIAKELGLEEINAITINHTKNEFPLICVPINWKEIKICKHKPKGTESCRNFRSTNPEILRRIDSDFDLKNPYNRNDFLYQTYRDFEQLGSTGIRKVGK